LDISISEHEVLITTKKANSQFFNIINFICPILVAPDSMDAIPSAAILLEI
jgi:hypothetical protein